jgi:hypothetical protein
MASLELTRLWKLHETDEAILSLQKRAAALDGGKKFQDAVKILTAQIDAHPYRKAHAEALDLNLQLKSTEDKLKKLDKDLFGGSVTSTREADTLQKEIDATKRQRDRLTDRLLELEEGQGLQKAEMDELQNKLDQYTAAAKKAHAEALTQQKQMQEEYAESTKRRPELAKTVNPGLLARYDGIRKKQGTGMARIKGGSCSACGMNLPEKTILGAKEDKVVTCEACHRILYFHEGL